jgi:hypothetical protein
MGRSQKGDLVTEGRALVTLSALVVHADWDPKWILGV